MNTILAIDTSCDETAVAITQGHSILANTIWSQVSLHEKWGGVVPSIAQRAHEERFDWVLGRAMKQARVTSSDIDAIAVTTGPGLAIALGVGIAKSKALARMWNKPLIPINHIEGHVLSPLATTASHSPSIQFPACGMVLSGGHTEIVSIKSLGHYSILASTQDDALGEALDKAARMLGLGYPGGAMLEKLAQEGNPETFPLPLPMKGREHLHSFSYSGLKAAMWRLVETVKSEHGILSKTDVCDLAASFQKTAFTHLIRISSRELEPYSGQDLLVGGGVVANKELRKQLRGLAKKLDMKIHFPYSLRLCGDNAGMIGVAASYKLQAGIMLAGPDIDQVDRDPRSKIDSHSLTGV